MAVGKEYTAGLDIPCLPSVLLSTDQSLRCSLLTDAATVRSQSSSANVVLPYSSEDRQSYVLSVQGLSQKETDLCLKIERKFRQSYK